MSRSQIRINSVTSASSALSEALGFHLAPKSLDEDSLGIVVWVNLEGRKASSLVEDALEDRQPPGSEDIHIKMEAIVGVGMLQAIIWEAAVFTKYTAVGEIASFYQSVVDFEHVELRMEELASTTVVAGQVLVELHAYFRFVVLR